jgi:type IV pilus assembly protein PilN
MRRVNLLPPEERRARRGAVPTATRAGIIGVLLILGAVLVLIMIGLYLYYFIQIGNEEEQIAQLDQDIARQQARIQELAPYRDLQARLDAKKPVADGIYRTRFAWDEFLRGLSFVIPESTSLDVFVGQATPININIQAGQPPEVQNLEPPGSITFNGFAEPEYQNVSDFIVRMNNLRFLANAQLTTAELDRQNFPRDGAVTFEVSAQLVTRVGEFGDEVRIASEQDEEEGENDETELPSNQASRPRVEY